MTPEVVEELQVRLASVLQKLDLADEAGDDEAMPALFEQATALQLALGDEDAARLSLERAADLHVQAGRLLEVAKIHYARGLLDGRKANRGRRAITHFERAIETFRSSGERLLEAKALMHIATLRLRDEDYAGADASVRDACDALATAGAVDELLAALRFRTMLLQIRGRPHDAYVCLSRTIEIAGRHGRSEELLQLRFDLYNLASNPLVDEKLAPETLDDLLAAAVRSGQGNLGGHILLQRAGEHVQKGRLDAARADAEVARSEALSGPDPLLYLMACLLIAEIEEKGGDRLGVMNILFTCQASLGDLLGDPARVPVLALIDSLERRWGPEAFAETLARYRAQFADARA